MRVDWRRGCEKEEVRGANHDHGHIVTFGRGGNYNNIDLLMLHGSDFLPAVAILFGNCCGDGNPPTQF